LSGQNSILEELLKSAKLDLKGQVSIQGGSYVINSR
jgi:hypothetical protein